jgi:AcrR family transcriptional regulator
MGLVSHEGHSSTVSVVSTETELSSGRWRQKQRTRQALIDAARELVTLGTSPTVEHAAEHAGISRTTAYRYFPNQRTLLVAAHPETVASSLLPPDASDDPRDRLRDVVERFTELISDTRCTGSPSPSAARRGSKPSSG